MDQPDEQIRSDASRWGGAALALGTLAYAIAVVSYVVLYGRPHGTGPAGEPTLADRVAHLQGRWRIAQSIWFVETLAALLIAVAGFVLQHRSAGQARLSPRFAWGTVGVGALLLSLMYPFMLGGYPTAAAAFREEPALFALVNDIATVMFNLGNAVVFLGLASAFATEATSRGAVPRGIAVLGVALCLIGTIAAIGMFMGVVAMATAAPLGLAVFALAAFLGFAIWRQGAPAQRVRQAPRVDGRA